MYEWDENKRIKNLRNKHIDFKNIDDFEWDSAKIEPDGRKEYGETRYKAYGFYRDRLTVLIFTFRQRNIRLISWRKANKREKRYYYDS